MVIAAFFLGMIYSVPLGPLGQIMLNRSIDRGFWHGFSIAIIGVLADFFLCETFLIGTGNIVLSSELRIALQGIGLVFLFYIGIKELILPAIYRGHIDKTNASYDNGTIQKIKFDGKSLLKNLFLVMVYYISNPAILVFWISFSALINQTFIHQQNLFNYTLFSLTFASGTLTCQYLSILFVNKIEKFSKIKGVLKYISSTLYIITISYFFYLTVQNILTFTMNGGRG
jgi:threonine/homoserine/homoserine lactone efflux protein